MSDLNSTPDQPRALSRRRFLMRAGTLAGGLPLALALAACGSGSQAPASAPAPAAPAAPANPPPAAPAAQPARIEPTIASAPAAAQATAAPAAAPAAQGVKKGGTVTLASTYDPKNLIPFLGADGASADVYQYILESVVKTKPETGEPYPWLAESWEISSDSLTYTFKIRKGIKWHDGQPFTAHDIKFTFDTILDPKVTTVRKALLSKAESFEVPDDYTFVVKMKQPYCPFIASTMTLEIIPKHILEKSADVNTDDYGKKPVGTGPFKFVEWVKDDHVTLTRNADWWYQPGGPNIETIVRKVVKDDTVILAQLKTGEVDLGAIQPALRSEVERANHLQIYKYFSPGYQLLGYNLARPLLQDKRVRQALTYGLDRDTIIATVYEGEAEKLAVNTPPMSWAFNRDLKPYPYDPAKAKALLSEAGWKPGADGILEKDGQKFQIEWWTGTASKLWEQVAVIGQQQYKELGIDVSIHVEEWNTFLDRLNKSRDYDLIMVGWGSGVDPDQETVWHSSQIKSGFNFVSYNNPEIDKLIEQGQQVAGCAPEARAKLYHQLQEILAEDQPYNFMFISRGITVVNKRVKNVKPGPMAGFVRQMTWNAHEWYIE